MHREHLRRACEDETQGKAGACVLHANASTDLTLIHRFAQYSAHHLMAAVIIDAASVCKLQLSAAVCQ
jgi:hypothetical protein